MKHIYFFLLACGVYLGILQVSPSALAGGGSSETVPRYNVVNPPLHRHYEDTRRYNAAPNRYGYQAKPSKSSVPTYQACSTTCAAPVKIRTDVMSQRTQQVVSYDSCGRRLCRNMTVTMYKDVFSNGGCRIWQHISH